MTLAIVIYTCIRNSTTFFQFAIDSLFPYFGGEIGTVHILYIWIHSK